MNFPKRSPTPRLTGVTRLTRVTRVTRVTKVTRVTGDVWFMEVKKEILGEMGKI